MIPAKSILPVLTGPLRGARWVVGSCTHGAWIGWYERETQRFFERVLKPGDLAVDVGANVGFFTLLAAKLVGPRGKVLAVEPYPANLERLERHCEINDVHAVEITPVALSDSTGTGRFAGGECGSMARLDEAGDSSVDVTTLDAVLESLAWPRPPKLVKIDVEGSEAGVLRGGRKTITASPRPALLVATHGSLRHGECLALLASVGIEVALQRMDQRTGNGLILVESRPRSPL